MTLTANCDQEAGDYPALVKGEDLGVRSGKYAAKLDEAYERIANGNACNAAVRLLYGAHLPGKEK